MVRTIYIAVLEEDAGVDLHSFLTGCGAEPRSDFGEWLVPVESKGSVKEELRRRGIKFHPRYEFLVESTDEVGDLAAYLGIEDLATGRVESPESTLLNDTETGQLVVGRGLLEQLLSVTSGLRWSRYEGSEELWTLGEVGTLPEPICTPHVFSAVQGGNGLWMVMDDGRSILMGESLEYLRIHGIALAAAKMVRGTILPHPPIPVFSGRVLEVLDRARVKLAFPPLYLVSEHYEISPW
ncbi:hypothetical protein PV396_23665 [Streptomyces sp. ME02-8801-2C]|uniref:hypothetical protein n=1 Tax=Streptomyces sp. ME02-8801-2C TaxID=3028680 RepID=UPI0029B41629|nr:hypothetical protein [Streptomyces sp. ME02-8801-2C]MDX3454899.1 hypothetical protein [Streptomyces sp. ME02-8801-2C]